MNYEFEIKGLEELKQNIQRNPDVIKREVGKFLTRGMAVYARILLNSPWRVGSAGGGVPVATGNLRDTHQKIMLPYEAWIRPTAPYAEVVHKNRPWLEYAFDKGSKDIEKLEGELMEEIANKLAE